jgi:hypothetical protein
VYGAWSGGVGGWARVDGDRVAGGRNEHASDDRDTDTAGPNHGDGPAE